MALTIPDGCYRQIDEAEGADSSGNTRNYIVKGDYDELRNYMLTLKIDMEIEDSYVVKQLNLSRMPGNLGKLEIQCSYETAESEDDSASLIDETWTIKSVRNDVSILAYCGDGENNPSRPLIEAWMKEPDGTLAAQGAWTKPDGTIVHFCETTDENDEEVPADDQSRRLASWDLCHKLLKGIDSVMRFYPMLTKAATYARMPSVAYDKLAMIDTPEISDISSSDDIGDEGDGSIGEFQPVMRKITINKPGNLKNIISDHEWLKCQDDLEKTADGNFRRVESWIGVLKSSGGWDANLYGDATTRWSMPYNHKSDPVLS